MFCKKMMAVFAGLVFFAGSIIAQQKNIPGAWRFHSINNVGLMEGQAGSAFQLQTINGVQHTSWFAGLGVGLDYYRYRTIPVFIDCRKEFGKSAGKLFVYADAGLNYYWQRDKDAKQFYVEDAFKKGFYGEGGGGYLIKLNKKCSFILSAGYSYKKITETGANYYLLYTDPINPPANNTEQINYGLKRIVLKVGFEF